MKIKLANRLPIALAERGIRSAAEFGRKLTDMGGYQLSTAQATRYMKESTPQFERAFIQAACNVLQCMPSDLFAITIELEPGEELDPRISVPRHTEIKRQPKPGKSPSEETRVPQIDISRLASSSSPDATKKKANFKPDESVTGPKASVFPFSK